MRHEELVWILVVLWTVIFVSLLEEVSGFSTIMTKRSSTTNVGGRRRRRVSLWLRDSSSSSSDVSLETISSNLNLALDTCRSDVAKVCKVQVGCVTEDDTTTNYRLGLFATTDICPGEVMLAVPYDDRFTFTPDLARNVVYKDILPEGYDGWTGDAGWIALLILNEVARCGSGGVNQPQRTKPLQDFVQAWILSLPSPCEMTRLHPYLWPEHDQEILQSSSTNKIYRALDDVDEDATWLTERIWSKDRVAFPEMAMWNGQEIPCFSSDGLKWAMALTVSRAVFVDGTLRLLPFLDMVNHDDDGTQEVTSGTMMMGTLFGTTKGAQLISSATYKAGNQVFCSYGPKSAADYLLDHGFCPPQVFKTAVSELTFELDSQDRFHDDKLDILEFETYDLAPMDPVQSFDIVSQVGRDGAPDPSMLQFVRLCKLGSTDAFLLESIFRKEVWDFMALPVSEPNELAVVDAIIDACTKALEDLRQCEKGGPEVCHQIRESETRALTRTMEYLQREKEALDLKEYYQERRLKDLGLDSEWSPEGDDIGFGTQRVPGGADYDW